MMTNGNYDWDGFYNISSLQQSRHKEDQERLNQLLYTFGTENGWKVCASFLLRDDSFNELYKQSNDLSMKDFFCFRGIEEYIKSWYSNTTNTETVEQIHIFLLKMIENYISNKSEKKENFLRNKYIHIVTKVAVIDYPTRWQSFFEDWIYILHRHNVALFTKDFDYTHITQNGIFAFELFFKLLISWDAEVGSREMQTNQFIERNTTIKDWMRDHDIVRIIDIVVFTIRVIGIHNTHLLRKAMKVISLYISWVDIRLVVNDAIVDGVVKPLSRQFEFDDNVKSASLDCLIGITNKGMPPSHKIELIKFLDEKLLVHGAWQWLDLVKDLPDDNGQDLGCDDDENDNCFFVTFGSLVNAMGLNLIDCYKSLKESKSECSNSCMVSINSKLRLALTFALSRNNCVATTCLPFIQTFITTLKVIYKGDSKKARRTSLLKTGPCTLTMDDEHCVLVRECLTMLVVKLQYPCWYNFDKEDEAEGNFQIFRRQLLNVLTNAIQLADQIVMKHLGMLLTNIIEHWERLPFQEVEMVLTQIYHVGEAIKSTKGDYFCADCDISRSLKQIMQALCASDIGRHKNPEVRLVFFETIFRYERFFNYGSEFLMEIIFLFLSEHGLKSGELRVVTRCVYILSRLIKQHKSKFGVHSVTVLQEISSILQTSHINNAILNCENSSTIAAYSYLYETASMLLVSLDIPDRHRIFHDLIEPLIIHVPQFSREWAHAASSSSEQNVRTATHLALGLSSVATYINYTCRAFSGSAHSMSALNCLEVFMSALDIFLSQLHSAFESVKNPLAPGRDKINSGLRSLIHILCKAAQSDSVAISAILQRLPCAIELFLTHLTVGGHGFLALCSELEEIIPLFMQIIHAFKNQCSEFLARSLWTLFGICESVIKSGVLGIEHHHEKSDDDQEVDEKMRQLRRLYLQLISSDVHLVFQSLTPDQIIQLLASCIQLIQNVECPDPMTIKLCVHIFHKIVTVLPTFSFLDTHTKDTILYQLIYKQLLPLLIYLPSCDTFNLSDAQFHLTLMEMANCQRSMFLNGGVQFIQYLQTHCLPELRFNSDLIGQYCQALNHHEKDYQAFLKDFYMQAKSR